MLETSRMNAAPSYLVALLLVAHYLSGSVAQSPRGRRYAPRPWPLSSASGGDGRGVWRDNYQNGWDWGDGAGTERDWRGGRRGGSGSNGLAGASGGLGFDGGLWKKGNKAFGYNRRPVNNGFGGGGGSYSGGDIVFDESAVSNEWAGSGGSNVVRPPWDRGDSFGFGAGNNAQSWGSSNGNNFGSGNNNNFAGNPWLSGLDNRPNNLPTNNRPNRPSNGGFNSNFGPPSTGRPGQLPSSIGGAKPPSTPRPNCGCDSTNEYNPVCGTDGATYENMARLRCARVCGKGSLTVKHSGACSIPPPSK